MITPFTMYLSTFSIAPRYVLTTFPYSGTRKY